jgi:stearoyl-CoA desaturase (delta-9 desaturase)
VTDLFENKDTTKLNWPTVIAFAAFHILALITIVFFWDWKAIAVAAVLYWMAIGWGIGMGYHRLHTHRSYKVPKWIDYLFAVCGTLTLQGGPISWVATHRVHHQLSDKPGDPHSPRDGAWWAHIIWMTVGDAIHNNTKVTMRYAPDLARDRFYLWLNDWHWVPLTISGLILLAVGGPAMLGWGLFVRVVAGWHATWLVNSATHLWGDRRFDTRDDSRNLWWVALVTFGEGWHNNHHAHPASARHGLAWYEFDLTWIQINLLERLGLARNVKVATVDGMAAEVKKAA